YAGGLLLLGDMVDKERGIILSEKRSRDTVSYRTFEAEFNETLGDTLLPKRMPIGQPDIISAAKRDQFVDFWNKWYRPEKLAVIIVGDFQDAGAVEEMVKTAYSGLKPRAAAPGEPSLGKLPRFKGVRTFYHADAESPATQIEITSITPYTHEPDTTARELKLLPRSLAVAMLNRRLAILAKKDNAPFVSASAEVGEEFNFYRDSSIEITCKPEQWQAALASGEQELRRALKYGFSAGELQDAVANDSRELRKAVKSESTRSSEALAGEIASTLVERTVFTSPDEDLALLKPALRTITPKQCLAALQAAFSADGRFVMVAGNLQIPGDANAAIAAAYKKSQAVAVAAPVPEKPAVWVYTNFGAPGKIVSRKHIDDLDIDEITFANGVRLNIKKTDFEAGTISLTARVGSGIVTEPAGKRGLSALAGSTFDLGGLGKLSVDDLQRVFAGNDVDLGFAPSPDAFTFSGETTPADLLLEMQFLAAKITDPGYRPESLRLAQQGFDETYNSFAHTVSGPRQTDVANLIAGGDPRFGFPPRDLLMQRNLDEVKDWVSPQLAHGAMEVSIIGDLDVDKTIDAAAKTIGALPARSPREDLTPLEKVAFPAAAFEKQFTIDSQIPKGHLSIFWPTNDSLDIHRGRRLSLLAAILSDRLRIQVREKIGGTYSPGAYSNASNTFAGYGYIEASIDVNPTMAAKIADVAVATADDLATQGITDDELERARKPLLTMLNETLRRNDYWLGSVLARAQEKPEMLDWARDRIADYNSITTAELSALAKQYLGKEHVSLATIQPGDAGAAKPAQSGAPAAEK
ncbi:MAG TPA: insulinase family protein, partial [Opitutus sp.]|nr:insulinase family protein [Opitutus sp.]